MVSREKLIEMLQADVLTVIFEKKDGTERLMHCTLKEDMLPPKPVKEGEVKVKKVNPNVLPVYDTDAKAFRSFRIDSIKKYCSSTSSPMED